MTSQFRCLDTGTPLTASRRNFRRIERTDEYPDTSWLDDDAGRERLDAFREGTWHLIGIQASANVLIPLGSHFVTQTVTSPGLFGIESDFGRGLPRRGLRRGMRQPRGDAERHRRHRNGVSREGVMARPAAPNGSTRGARQTAPSGASRPAGTIPRAAAKPISASA